MKRLLIIDTASFCLDMAMRAKASGWDVKWYDKAQLNGDARLAGDGMFEKVQDFNEIQRKWLDWADLIYLPYNDLYLHMLESYRLKGYPILAPSEETATWEIDRMVGQKVMKDAGLAVIPTKLFNDHHEAVAFVKKNPKFLVSKPCGDIGNDKAMSYVAHAQSDLVFMLEKWSKNPKYVKEAKKSGFILQEKKHGIEMAVGGWFGPHGWSQWWYENFEYKKLMNGDLGVATGEMGTLSRMTKNSKLAKEVLIPLTDKLKKCGYVGYIDNNCMIDSDAPWPMEFTMRDGWPTKHNITAHIKNEDHIQWQLDLINGKDTIEAIEGEVCVSVLIALPDFPYSHITNKELCGFPVTGADDMKHIHLIEAMIGDAPTMVGDKVITLPGYVTCGDQVMCVTGTGDTITSARASAYRAVKKVKIPNNPFYRLDIGAGRMKQQLPELHRMGYAKGLEF